MSAKLRLIDIAKKANVSIGTVDRVVNKRGKVAAKTEKKILEILKEFDYHPNLMASSLSSKKKTKFAVLMPKPQGEDYWNKILTGIETSEKTLIEYGIEIKKFLYNQDDDIQFTEMTVKIMECACNGILLAPIFHKETKLFVNLLEERNIPYVFIDSMIDDTHPLCHISQNDFQSGVLAAKLLNGNLNKGDELLSISHVTHTDYFDHMQDRLNGFKSYFDTMSENKRVIHTLQIVNPKYEKIAILLEEQLTRAPKIKGIFIDNSKAYWVARYLNEKSLSSIKLVGFDLIEQNVKYIENETIDFILFDFAENQGKMGLKVLFDYVVKKTDVTSRICMPIHIVTKENLEGFYHKPIVSLYGSPEKFKPAHKI